MWKVGINGKTEIHVNFSFAVLTQEHTFQVGEILPTAAE
jgi:hypothetical protein